MMIDERAMCQKPGTGWAKLALLLHRLGAPRYRSSGSERSWARMKAVVVEHRRPAGAFGCRLALGSSFFQIHRCYTALVIRPFDGMDEYGEECCMRQQAEPREYYSAS